jgi:hypothetical protein
MSIIEPLLLPLVVPCGVTYIVTRTSKQVLDVIALALVLRETSPPRPPRDLAGEAAWIVTLFWSRRSERRRFRKVS